MPKEVKSAKDNVLSRGIKHARELVGAAARRDFNAARTKYPTTKARPQAPPPHWSARYFAVVSEWFARLTKLALDTEVRPCSTVRYNAKSTATISGQCIGYAANSTVTAPFTVAYKQLGLTVRVTSVEQAKQHVKGHLGDRFPWTDDLEMVTLCARVRADEDLWRLLQAASKAGIKLRCEAGGDCLERCFVRLLSGFGYWKIE